jgi:hypothetical protein
MGGVCRAEPHKHPPNPLFEGICYQKMSYAIALEVLQFDLAQGKIRRILWIGA